MLPILPADPGTVVKVSRLDAARGVILGALALAVIANVAQFPVIERDVGTTYAAINRYEDADVPSIVTVHTPTVRQRFQLYAELRSWARDAEVFIGPRSGLQRDQLVGLSGLGQMHDWTGVDALSDSELARLVGHVVADGEDRWAGPFVIALFDQEVVQLAAIRHDGTLYVADVRLLEASAP